MRVVIQRVSQASVRIDSRIVGEIGRGILLLAGFEAADSPEDLDWMTKKIVQLRIFDDEAGVMNRSLIDEQASILVVSQFTLHASTKKGNRPSYIRAASPSIAIPLYELFLQKLQALCPTPLATGRFGAEMQVALVNDGPVTICIDTFNKE
jgi:D-tyrosyl-tRNA(Tyr) deacylase